MKTLLLSLLLILTFCICAFGQKAKTTPCPKVAVETSFISVIDGDPMTFTAKITGAGNRKLKYKWTLSNGGGILEGQGTPEIRVNTLGFHGEEIKATLTVSGLPKRCKTRASATGFVKPKPYLNQDTVLPNP
jgi:hypothetical protein